MNAATRDRFRRLLEPRSVAIVGASEKPGSFGASVLANLDAAGYAGAVYLINPRRERIGDRVCLPDVAHLPEGVDCAVLAIPKAGVLEAVRACGRRGVGAVVTFSAGFGESGADGQAAQRELSRACADAGMVLLGPNCLGLVNARDGVALTFVATPPSPAEDRAGSGVAVLSQSGAMAAVLGVVFRAHGLPLRFSVSTGNEAGSGLEDYLEYVLEDEGTRVISMLAEQLRQPQRFLALARAAAERGKHLVLLHPGSSQAARTSAATHTGAIAGDYEVMRAKVASAGVVLVETVEELADVTHLLLRCPVLPRPGTAVFTESGAFKALTLDLCERVGLPLPEFLPATADALRAVLPEFIAPSNPLDITAHGLVDPDLYRRTLPPLLADPRIGAVVLTIILTDAATGALKLPPILHALRELAITKPIVFAALDEGAWIDPDYVRQLRALAVPFFPTAERAFRALARLQAREAVVPLERRDTHSAATPLPSGTMTEFRSKQVLRAAGLPVPEGAQAQSADEAVQAAEQLGYPVVLKAQSPQLPHKTEAGGVILNLANEAELREGWQRLEGNLRARAPEVALDGVLVERFRPRGTELIVGGRNDPEWGPVLLAGLGGVMAEALHDARLMVPGTPRPQMLATMLELKGAALLRGFRGAPAPDLDAVIDIVDRLGAWLVEHPEVAEVDLNPVVAYPTGALALDALIVVR